MSRASGHRIPGRPELVWRRLRALHLPLIGHRLSPKHVQVRPKLYCWTCLQAGAVEFDTKGALARLDKLRNEQD